IKDSAISSFTFKLCKNLLKLLNGKLELISGKDGNEGIFIFPLKLEKDLLVEDKEEINNSAETDILSKTEIISDSNEQLEEIFEAEKEISNQQFTLDLSQLSCLYIEDQVDSQMLFSMQMSDLKEVTFAVSLEQSIPLLNNKDFDFIVVDINLQGDYNGLDILKIIKTMSDYENVPVIAATAYLIPVNKDLYIKAGFSDFISKPILRKNLLDSLEKTLIPTAPEN
ncbi:MAG TPA: response regulator, partial [Ignavibacteriaceae bacterium]|nr:response regulator [Ignavibacteriaceae bacterium]